MNAVDRRGVGRGRELGSGSRSPRCCISPLPSSPTTTIVIAKCAIERPPELRRRRRRRLLPDEHRHEITVVKIQATIAGVHSSCQARCGRADGRCGAAEDLDGTGQALGVTLFLVLCIRRIVVVHQSVFNGLDPAGDRASSEFKKVSESRGLFRQSRR